MKKVVYIVFVVSSLFCCQNKSIDKEKQEVEINDLNGIIENTPETIPDIMKSDSIRIKGIYIKDSSDYTFDFLNALNQEGIEVKYLVDSFYIIGDGSEDTFQFPELPRFGEGITFENNKDELKIRLWLKRRNYNSISYHLDMFLLDKIAYTRRGVAEIGPFFYHGAETDDNIETGNSYLSIEYSDEYSSSCYFGLRIGSDDETGEVLCKIEKKCNNKIQDITLDNFPNLKLKK